MLLDPHDKDNEGIAGCLTDYMNICVDEVSSVSGFKAVSLHFPTQCGEAEGCTVAKQRYGLPFRVGVEV